MYTIWQVLFANDCKQSDRLVYGIGRLPLGTRDPSVDGLGWPHKPASRRSLRSGIIFGVGLHPRPALPAETDRHTTGYALCLGVPITPPCKCRFMIAPRLFFGAAGRVRSEGNRARRVRTSGSIEIMRHISLLLGNHPESKRRNSSSETLQREYQS